MTCAACHAPVGDNGRFCPMCGTPVLAASGAREARKNVAILFMDLVDSTALAESLDPEPLSQIMHRYFRVAAAAISAHGGVVEKFIGDAVMAVFGATVSHEDDALRAVRAALETVEHVGELSEGLRKTHKVTLQVRCGVCSGEVIAITNPAGEVHVVGDPANTASRLQTSAPPGQVLVDTATASMIRTSVGIEPVPALQLKGKAKPVPAWRVTGREPAQDAAVQVSAPLIGRESELTELRSAFRQVTRRNRLCLVTLLGMPGIGKSRLVRDFVATFGPADVTVLAGKCSAYGRGITYQPLAEMLVASGWAEQAREMAAAGGDAARAAKSLASIMGGKAPIASEPAGIEEISWAVRYLLAQLGQKKPVIMIWEDLQWAEATLLDMIDDVVNWLTDVPVLVLCVSRLDLLDSRPSWAAGKPSALTMEIGPLNQAESVQLVAEIAMREEVSAHQAEVLCERVASECEGNPLFAELMLDVFADEACQRAKLPPTITALMTARLDQLPHDERELLEVAAAIGRDFSLTALTGIFDAEHAAGRSAPANPPEVLDRLVRRRILTRDVAGGYRFVQVLMRDMAYQLSPKTRRERWHLLLAAQLAEAGGQLELARHVEDARKLQLELRPGDSELPERAGQAAEILIAEGETALHRRDLPSAAALLERGRGLLAADDERQVPLMLYISDCLSQLSDPAQAVAAVSVLAETTDLARAGGGLADRRRQAVCRVQLGILELRLELRSAEETAGLTGQLAAELESLERSSGEPEDRAWCRLHQLRAYLHQAAEASARAEAEFRLALERARAVEDSYETDRMLVAICELAQWTQAPVGASLKLCAEMSERFATNRVLLLPVLLTMARLRAVSGDLAGAKAALSQASEYTADLHIDLAEVVITAVSGLVDSLAGDHRGAEAGYRRSHALLLQMGRSGDALAYEAYAAREIFEQGNVNGAQQAADRLATGAAAMDLRSRIIVNALRARIASVRGQPAQALYLAGDSTKLSEETDDLCLQGDCYADLAIAATAAGRPGTAAAAARTAVDRYEAKGASLLAGRARRLIAGA
ncbi:MAG TPA: AAA family ATPase [Streptosporangiaceae bacterium]|nr:AAA family ATPase [Streptosporangiaceae bacterium]